MSAIANATPIVITVTKTTNKEKAPDVAPEVNIVDFCEEYYEDIMPIIMDKKTRLRESILRDPGLANRNVFSRLSHRRKSVHERLSNTYSPSATKSGPSRMDSRDPSYSRGHHPRRERPRIKEHSRSAEESYGDTYSQETKTKYRDRSGDGDQFRSVKRRRESESPSSRRSESSTSGMLAMPTWCHMFNSTLIGAARVWFDELPLESIDGYKGLKVAFLAYFMQQKKYVKDLVEIHNIKQRDRETIEDLMERFKVETERMKGAPECMWISGFMHGVNNPELTERLNEQ
ncbi:reverse transcriptase domain-containing protein, partial [Tanacetum coccineum]